MSKALKYFFVNADSYELDRFYEVLNDFMWRVKERKEVIDFLTDGGKYNIDELIKERMINEDYLTAEESEGYVIEELIVNRLLDE